MSFYRYLREKNSKLALFLTVGLVLSALFVGWDFGWQGGVLSLITLFCFFVLLILYKLPEFPFVILTMGMPIWALISSSILPITEGVAVPITLLLASVATMLQLVFTRENRRKFKARINLVDIWLIVFTGWLWLALLWSAGKDYGQFKALGFTAYTLSAYLIIRVGYRLRKPNLRRMAWLMVLAGIGHFVVVFIIAFQEGLWSPFQNLGLFGYRIRLWNLSFIAEPDALTLGFVASLALLVSSKRSKQVLLIFACLIQLWAFLFFQQRGATLALIAAAGVIFRYLPVQNKGRRSVSTVWFRLFGLILLAILSTSLIALNPQFEMGLLLEDRNVLTRLELYSTAWELFLKNPLFGVGTGSTGVLTRWGTTSYAHNRFLEILSELGLVGAFSILAFSIALFRLARRELNSNLGRDCQFGTVLVSAVLLSRYVVGMFSSDLGGWNIGVWAGLLVALSNSQE